MKFDTKNYKLHASMFICLDTVSKKTQKSLFYTLKAPHAVSLAI